MAIKLKSQIFGLRKEIHGKSKDAGKILEKMVESGHPDMAVSFARQWLKIRPAKETPNTTVLQALVPLLTEAKLI